MTATNVRVQMQQRRDTAAGWTSAGPTLLSGEIGYETDTGKIKLGDGSTAWASLGYLSYVYADSSGDVVISGDLQVDGTTTTINSTTLDVADKDITVSKGSNSQSASNGAGLIVDCGSETDATLLYDGTNNEWDFNAIVTAPSFSGNISGNATSATALETARTIGGVSFDGSANIDLAGVNTTGNQDTTGNAGTATALATARDINGTAFNGSGNITVTAAAGTLTGATLNSGVTASSLTSVGTLTALTSSGDLTIQDSTAPSLALYTGSTIRGELKATTGLTTLFSHSNSPVTFNIGGSAETEAMRIDSSGVVNIGDSSTASPKITLTGSTGAATFKGVVVVDRSTSGDGCFHASLNGTVKASITSAGVIEGTSKNFRIPHPLPSKEATHQLVHSSLEGPQADLIYSGMVTLIDGKAEINLDTAARMTEGTFLLLNTNLRRFVSNEGGWTAVKSSITGNVLTVEAQDDTCTDEVFWTVIGERKDQSMIDSGSTDENGRLITEPLKPVEVAAEEEGEALEEGVAAS